MAVVLRRCLEFDRDQRAGSADEVCQLLEQAQSTLSDEQLQSQLRNDPQLKRDLWQSQTLLSQWRPALFVGLVLLVVVASLGMLVWIRLVS